jgi:hypothetical protein
VLRSTRSFKPNDAARRKIEEYHDSSTFTSKVLRVSLSGAALTNLITSSMEFFENKLSPCFERSTSRESVFTKDRPSPLRIVKKRHNYSRQQNSKGDCASAGVEGSPPGSFEEGEPPRILKLPRRRPKSVSGKSTSHENEVATG